MNIAFHMVTCFGNLGVFASPRAIEDIGRLVRNVTFPSPLPTEETLRAFFSKGRGTLAFVCDDGEIVGMATLVYVSKINSVTARIEHVSVLSQYQDKGIARKLVDMLIVDARILDHAERVRYIDLTTEPSREAANALYAKVGFQRRETNVYRLALKAAP